MKRMLSNLNIFSRLKAATKTNTFRQSSITFSGTMVNGFLGALFYLLSARYLGPSSFGILSVSIATLALTADIANFGVNTALVRFVSKYFTKDKDRANRFLKLGIEIKIIASFGVLMLGYLGSSFLANYVFAKPEMLFPLRLSFIGVGTTLLFSFTTSFFQSSQRFVAWSLIQILTNFLRLSAVVLIFILGFLSVDTVIVGYILMPFLGFVISICFIPNDFWKVKKEWSVSNEFFNYNKWVALFSIVSAVSARVDTFISARLLSTAEVGIYSAANQLVQVVPQIIAAISTVIAPKISSMGSLKSLISYLKKTQMLVVGIAVLAILSIPLASYLIPLFYGSQYLASVKIFTILLIASLIFLISVPIHNAIFYYFSKPSLFFWLSLLNLSIVMILGWNLISAYGVVGAAISVLVGQFFNFLIPLIWVLREIRLRSLRETVG